MSERDLVEVSEVGEILISRHENAGVKIRYLVPSSIWNTLGAIAADQSREQGESLDLYKAGKLGEKDFRVSIEATNATAEERSVFRRWITNNATIDLSR